MMPPVSEANDSIGATSDVVTAETVLRVDDVPNMNANDVNLLLPVVAASVTPTMTIKANHNTVVVVAESVTKRPDAAEARRRRKERLLKQAKQQPGKADKMAASTTASLTDTNTGVIVVDPNSVAEAATLAAVVAAAAAAVDASEVVDLVSTEVIDHAVNAAAPSGVIENEIDTSTATTDMPFLDDADIAATAAAVAMNSVATTTTAAATNSTNTVTAPKKKVPKRKRQADKGESSNKASNNDNVYDDCNDMDHEEDDYDEHGQLGSGNNSKKTQIRYDPSIPMEKDQLAAWRREARRVRNRESAAASRQRIRGRITELEDELDDMKQKYETAMANLQHLQQQQNQNGILRPNE